MTSNSNQNPNQQFKTTINERSQSNLGWDFIQNELKNRTKSPLGKDTAAIHLPYESHTGATRLRSRSKECLTLLKKTSISSLLKDTTNPEDFFISAGKNAVLTAEQVFSCGHFMQTISFIGHDFTALKLKEPIAAPQLIKDWELAPKKPDICAKIMSSVNSSGIILDTASTELARLRKSIRDKRAQFESLLDSKIKTWAKEGFLQDSFYDVIDDRYVVPVKVEQQAKIHGVLHDKSNTGLSVYIEPIELTSANNELKELSIAIQAEEYRILTELSKSIGSQKDTYIPWIELAAELDLSFAGAQLAIDFDLHPQGKENPTELKLHNLFHPALKTKMEFTTGEKKLIHNSITLGEENNSISGSALIISGPNTGGKTVLLKAAGLAALMSKAGLFIPADPDSLIPHYKSIFALIGDEQNIESGLSSFSAQIKDLSEVYEQKGSPHLILVDEILSSTSPDEASALAQSFLEAFLERQHHTIITTHFAELSLKTRDNPLIRLCGMEFKDGLPTYRLLLDELGSSHAIEVAQNLGLPQSLISRALTLMSSVKLDYEKAKKGLSKKEEELKTEAAKKEQDLAGLKIKLTQEHEDKLRHLEKTLDHFTKEIKEKFESKVEELTKHLNSTSKVVTTIRQKAKEAISTSETELQKIHTETGIKKDPSIQINKEIPLTAGSTVRIKTLGNQIGQILEIKYPTDSADKTSDQSSARVIIQSGLFRLEKPLSELEHVKEDHSPSTPSMRALKNRFAGISSSDLNSSLIPSKLDLRGKRLDVAMSEFERYVDQAFRSGKALVTIVTGHGTGAIKAAVKDYLSKLSYVKDFRPERDGNDGALIIEFDQ